MSTKRPGLRASHNLAFAVRARPIADADLAQVRLAMAGIASGWSVELQGVRAEEATLVLVPDGGDDANGPSFVISRETYGFRLDQVHWDTLTEVGVFATLNDVVAALRPRVAFCSATGVLDSVTLH